MTTTNRFVYEESAFSVLIGSIIVSILFIGTMAAVYFIVFFNNVVSFYASVVWILCIGLIFAVSIKDYGLNAVAFFLVSKFVKNRYILVEKDINNNDILGFGL